MSPREPLAATVELVPEPEEIRRRSLSSLAINVALVSSTPGSLKGRVGGVFSTLGLGGLARRTLGISLLLVTVFLWTTSNFLASYIFSDHTYDKPFFLVYMNTSLFAFSLLPLFLRYYIRHGMPGVRAELAELLANEKGSGYRQGLWHGRARPNSFLGRPTALKPSDDEEHRLLSGRSDEYDEAGDLGAVDDTSSAMQIQGAPGFEKHQADRLSLRETGLLSLEFCMLWFCANYFASACLEYTSVGSVTILTSTSSIWTLVFCAAMRVESFSARKLAGVLASLVGVVLISSVDLSGQSDEARGSFPHKSQASIAVGDGMAFFSAIVYGLYVTVMKSRVGDENRVNMPLFFGLVGLLNLVFLWPGFFILHWTGIEPFEWPPTGKVWAIIILNSFSSFVSDISWAFAMLLTSPLVVTVGLSLTIPLSLIGEMIQYGQYSSWIYWAGAGIVLVSFLFVNHESTEEGENDRQAKR